MSADLVERHARRLPPWCRAFFSASAALLAIALIGSLDARGTRAGAPPFELGAGTHVADGIDLFRPASASVLETPGPIEVQALRVDTTRARLAIGLADGVTPARRTVAEIVERDVAVAGVNASFFDSLGHQLGLLKHNGIVLATSARPRGAVAWGAVADPRGQRPVASAATPGRGADLPLAGSRFVFDRVRSRLAVRVDTPGRSVVAVDHVNPPSSRAGVSLYTTGFRLPIWGRSAAQVEDQPGPVVPPTTAGTSSAAGGRAGSVGRPRFEAAWRWLLRGSPLRVTKVVRDGTGAVRVDAGTTAVLVYRGEAKEVPASLRALKRGSRVEPVEDYDGLEQTSAADWTAATFAVAGAGLLIADGRKVEDWTVEDLRAGFTTERHPRTLIGTDAGGAAWLVTVDGRRPGVSVGMSFVELQRLAVALGLVNALNLDGGGSTTMVVQGAIVNRPTDLTGPRAVPDAVLVKSR